MKNIWRAIIVIIEIAIACLIFFFIATKTPLFERAIPGWNIDNQSGTNLTGGQHNQIPETTIQTQSGTIIQPGQYTGVTTIYESNGDIAYFYDNTGTLISQHTAEQINTNPLDTRLYPTDKVVEIPVRQGNSCITPWGEKVADKSTIIAYQSATANRDNVCISEIRSCTNGILGGSYTHSSCNYMIDGTLILADGNKVEITEGAMNDNQQWVNLESYIKKRDSIPDRYIQPVIVRDSSTPTLSQVRPQGMYNSTIKESINYGDGLDQTTVRDSEYTYQRSCITPWGERIRHGNNVYAYSRAYSSSSYQCLSQVRSCINGELSGTYQYKSCHVQGSNQPIATITTIENTWNTGWILPDVPYVRPLHISVNDPLRLIYPNSWSNTYYENYNNNQNYIEFGACMTPWGTTVDHNRSVIAYRLPRGTSNSHCDAQVRTCRDGVLGGSYTYPSCREGNPADPNDPHYPWRQWWHWFL